MNISPGQLAVCFQPVTGSPGMAYSFIPSNFVPCSRRRGCMPHVNMSCGAEQYFISGVHLPFRLCHFAADIAHKYITITSAWSISAACSCGKFGGKQVFAALSISCRPITLNNHARGLCFVLLLGSCTHLSASCTGNLSWITCGVRVQCPATCYCGLGSVCSRMSWRYEFLAS